MSVPQNIDANPLKINPNPIVSITVAKGGCPIIWRITVASRRNPKAAIISAVKINPTI